MQRSGDEEAFGFLIQQDQDMGALLCAGPGRYRARVTSEQLQAAMRVAHAYAGRWAGQAARLRLPSSSAEEELNAPPSGS